MVLYDTPPWPIQQTDTTAASGNALQACVAALLHLELSAVPNFLKDPSGYQQALHDYMQQTHGLTCRKIVLTANDNTSQQPRLQDNDDDSGKMCILRGQSPRGSFGHVVVAKILVASSDKGGGARFDIVWDPHPDATGLDSTIPYGWYMVFDDKDDHS